MGRYYPGQLGYIHGCNDKMRVHEVGRDDVSSFDMVIFFAIHIVSSHLAIPILAITYLLLKFIAKNILIANLLISWIGSSACALVLLYASQIHSWGPTSSLCTGQAAAVNAFPVMCNVALLSLVVYIWTRFDLYETQPDSDKSNRVRRFCLALILTAPYLVFVIFLVFGLALPTSHNRNGYGSGRYLYCQINPSAFTTITAVLSLITSLECLAFEGYIVWAIYKKRQQMREASFVNGIDHDLICRIVLFTFVQVVANIVNLVASAVRGASLVAGIFWALATVAVFLIFASHPDIKWAWRCHRPVHLPDDIPEEDTKPGPTTLASLVNETEGAGEAEPLLTEVPQEDNSPLTADEVASIHSLFEGGSPAKDDRLVQEV